MVWLDNTDTVDVGFLSINSRIKVSDDYGTIRYLGEVNTNKKNNPPKKSILFQIFIR